MESITPPTIIFVCIAGAIIILLVAYSVDKIGRRAVSAISGTEQSEPEKWNPNKRSQQQNEYMQKVRLRTKASIWDRAQIANLESGSLTFEEVRIAVVRRRYEARRMRYQERSLAVVDDDITNNTYDNQIAIIQEYLDTENPYRQMLQESATPTSSSMYGRSEEQQSRINLNQADSPIRNAYDDGFEEVALGVPSSSQHLNGNTTGVRITVNDDSNDIVEDAFVGSSRWPPRQSRMFRSSSIYSGDAILPSTHLHLVQSSSTYDLSNSRPISTSRGEQNVEEYELRDRRQ